MKIETMLSKADNSPLISIIMLTCNGLHYTKESVYSILQHTKENYELIFIDNGSTDGTVDFINSLNNAKVIINSTNQGFPSGCNQGFAIANGSYIVLLNNDTVVTDGWLTRLLWWLESDKTIGIVGPRSNHVLPSQIISNVPYKSMNQMHSFASQWTKNHYRHGFEVDYLSGLCMVFKKSLLAQIGGMDERFNPGYFEDADFSIRASIAGNKLWVANDVYIHHHGSGSFKKDRRKQRASVVENQVKFFEKWKINYMSQVKELVQLQKPFKMKDHYIPYSKTNTKQQEETPGSVKYTE
jgi:GT2 family glycosyltransferase